jgi:hypothetical protein
MISDFRKQQYFCGEGWTGQISLELLAKFVFRSERFQRMDDTQDRL